MTEIRTRARHVVVWVAPIAAATANESRPSGRTKASSFSTYLRLSEECGRRVGGELRPPGQRAVH
jgi:hypothetical protein